MKWWHVLLGAIAVFVISGFVVPPRIRCKFFIWNPNACADVETASNVLGKLGYDIDPSGVPITQSGLYKATGDVLESIQ